MTPCAHTGKCKAFKEREREIMLFVGNPIGRSKMISSHKGLQTQCTDTNTCTRNSSSKYRGIPRRGERKGKAKRG